MEPISFIIVNSYVNWLVNAQTQVQVLMPRPANVELNV